MKNEEDIRFLIVAVRNGEVVHSMIKETKIHLEFEKNGGVGIFSLSGELTNDHEDDLEMVLMKALYSTERAVVNFKDVTKIDDSCVNLLRKAYCTSIRLKSPIIMTGIPQEYADGIFQCNEKQERNFHLRTDHSLNFTGKEFRQS